MHGTIQQSLIDDGAHVQSGAIEQMHHGFRLLTDAMPGIAGTLAATWRSYSNIEEARLSAMAIARDSRVRRVALVEDINVLELVEWIDLRRTGDRSAASVLSCNDRTA